MWFWLPLLLLLPDLPSLLLPAILPTKPAATNSGCCHFFNPNIQITPNIQLVLQISNRSNIYPMQQCEVMVEQKLLLNLFDILRPFSLKAGTKTSEVNFLKKTRIRQKCIFCEKSSTFSNSLKFRILRAFLRKFLWS